VKGGKRLQDQRSLGALSFWLPRASLQIRQGVTEAQMRKLRGKWSPARGPGKGITLRGPFGGKTHLFQPNSSEGASAPPPCTLGVEGILSAPRESRGSPRRWGMQEEWKLNCTAHSGAGENSQVSCMVAEHRPHLLLPPLPSPQFLSCSSALTILPWLHPSPGV
jgi:hypothetical protein